MAWFNKFEVKAQPHPERPDRLRAIAASLATAGIVSLAYIFQFAILLPLKAISY